MNYANTPDVLIFLSSFFILLGMGMLLQREQAKRYKEKRDN